MSRVKIEIPVIWASNDLVVVGDYFDGNFEFESAYFADENVYIDIDKLGVKNLDEIMDKVYRQVDAWSSTDA